MIIGVIGAGAWGTALAITSARAGNDVVLWSYDGECKEFDDVEMPKNLTVTRDLADISNANLWLIVTPSAFFRETIRKLKSVYKNQPIIICTKGAESDTGAFMSEILSFEMPECSDFGVLSGPQFAAEVARGVPTGSTLAGGDTIQKLGRVVLSELELHESDDIIGTQICGIGKNAVALIAGYNSIAAAGENERALYFTNAWNEVMNIGLAMGAKLRTFTDLCGIGDLFLSATSTTSRNCAGGVSLARGLELVGTVEGIYALRGLIGRGADLGIATPTLCEMRAKMKI